MTGFPSALPAPRVPDSMAAPSLRWGVLGTGWIAERFVRSLKAATRQEVVAVGSRTAERARAFAAGLDLPRAHGSYHALVADPEVHVVYVATPHNVHRPCALLALEAGKHVLVEKPLALSASEAEEVAALARTRGLFCMEALWTFFLPRFDVVRQVLDGGLLGEVRTVLADNGEHFEPDHRIFRADLAGGPLLDLGTYPVALATAVLGEPEAVAAFGQPAPSGVNGQIAAILSHAGGTQSALHTTLLGLSPVQAVVVGDAATLVLPGPFYQPGPVVVMSPDGRRRVIYDEPALAHHALHHQAAAAASAIVTGAIGCPQRPLEDSIATLRVLDEIRRQIGVVFDEERGAAPTDAGADRRREEGPWPAGHSA